MEIHLTNILNAKLNKNDEYFMYIADDMINYFLCAKNWTFKGENELICEYKIKCTCKYKKGLSHFKTCDLFNVVSIDKLYHEKMEDLLRPFYKNYLGTTSRSPNIWTWTLHYWKSI